MHHTTSRDIASALFLLTALSGCGAPASPCDRTVSPADGDDTIAAQTMFVEAEDGDTLCFAPGTYQISDPLEIRDRSGITIRGDGAAPSDVVLDFFDQESGAKGISATAMTDLVIENLTALDSPGDDIYVTASTGVTLRDLRAGWVRRVGMSPGSYALYPVNSTNVVVEDTEVFAGADSGVYVGQTTNCVVRRVHAHHNVSGIEIENSTNCEVYENDVEHNTAGILVFEVPGLPMRGSTTSVHDNRVCSSDTLNFAYPGTTVSYVPNGIGVMVLAANRVEVHHNEVCENGSTGILVISYPVAQLAGMPASTDPTYDGLVDDICVHDNTFSGNGSLPDGAIAVVADLADVTTMEDILWDGLGTADGDFCVDATGSFRDADFPSMFQTQSTDRTPVLCGCEPIPHVDL